MARPRSAVKTVAVTVHLTPELHRSAQMKALVSNTTMSELIRRVLTEHMIDAEDTELLAALERHAAVQGAAQ